MFGSSDEFTDANVQLALAVVRKLQEIRETRARIVFPDKPERRRASELFKSAIDLSENCCILLVISLKQYDDHVLQSLILNVNVIINPNLRLINPYMSLIQVDGITIGSLDDIPAGPVSSFFKSIRNTLDFDFDDENEG
ncbi:hypothetical protein Hanom_Chr07g00589301 [Helianthus anomalus]